LKRMLTRENPVLCLFRKHCAEMGQASFMQQLLALVRRNWIYKLRTRNTTYQVYRLAIMYSAV